MSVQSNQAIAGHSAALPIRIRELTKRYGKLYALNQVSLDIHSGEFLTLLGPSGSGKTTLLMAIAGFNRPDAGSIYFGDTEVILTPPHKRDVGMVFQSYALFPHMTVAQNIAFPLKLRGIGKVQRLRQADEALETVQLAGLGDRRIDQLSGGQRQRVALARAFVFKPRILLMDEPLSALDKKLRERMQIELKQLHRQLGVTTVYVTHDQREALTMSDRIAVINHGELVQVDTPEAIYNAPSNVFVADFIGESTMLPLSRNGSGELLFQDKLIAPVPDNNHSGDWVLAIRPERLHISEHTVDLGDSIKFTGMVKESVFQGETAFVIIALEDATEITVRFETGTSSQALNFENGRPVMVRLDRQDVIVIPAGDLT